MDLGNLTPAKGSVKGRKRIGRGNASGQGRTAGRGNNGYKSRSGSKSKLHYEGGQTPLMRRLPKRGFSNYHFRKEVQVVNLDRIASLKLEKVDINTLIENGIIKKANALVKILGNGEITSAVEVSADMFSQTAIEKIEKAGGKVVYQ
ncbi:MAG: 50S ribosomal protein L15 [Candidatus Marinimicrobia bacterium]|nr:50S ribosomal protein L15 [Candidatus Neomarinimicrobiota bacterium]MBL7023068.1 50S ribosomal protein L15 [Candidatus Neomarinimicrobiota bacterium]MBL7109088.1 50S ribosomal protein L15 [Candidatus Neomarinimicrobiota bacterium]